MDGDDWKQRARIALAKRQDATHGSREAAWEAAFPKVHLNTIRRNVAALRFLDRIEKTHPDLYRDVADAPFSAVELVNRWLSFDGEAARIAARRLARGEYSVETLTQDYNVARRRRAATAPSAKMRHAESRTYHLTQFAVMELLGGTIEPWEPAERAGRLPTVDFRMFSLRPDAEKLTVAALVVGPYEAKAVYASRRHDWIFRGVVTAWAYDVVVLVLAEKKALKGYREAITAARKEIASVRLDGGSPVGNGERPMPRLHVICPEDFEHRMRLDEDEVDAVGRAGLP